jgi:tetratricopeptide (TPR) repeat protein
MPYVEGESLRARLLAERQLGYEEALQLTSGVARALDYAHRQGVVHRDIKPENILLADGQAMVADFGIARAVRLSGGEKLTETGMVLGSPPYMSPEQITGIQDVDGRSDLYALGCVLYEMLAGQPPFTGPPETLPHQHLNLAPRPIRELRPTTSLSLDAALSRLLAKVPAERFESGAALVAALGRPSHAPLGVDTSADTVAAGALTTLRGRRMRRVWVGIALAVVALVIAGTMLWRSGRIGPGAEAPQGARRWVWVANFAANGGETGTAPAVQELVAAALDQSKVVSTVPIEQVKIALRNSGRPDTTSVPAELARELAYRSSIPVVIEGTVTRLGPSTALTLKATSSQDGRVLASVTGSANNESDLVTVVTRLARDLRRGLGENSDVFATTASWTDAPTPSFEAFKLYLRGKDLINGNDPWAAIPILRRATALDPEFATAWSGIGIAFVNMGRRDSAQVYQRLALRYPERLPLPRRLLAEAQLAELTGDRPRAIQAYDEILHIDAAPVERATALNNKAGLLVGMPEQVFELLRQSAALEPVAPTDITVSNMTDALIEMRRIPEAHDMARKIRGPIGRLYVTELLLIDRSWDRADSLVNAIQRDPALSEALKRRARGAAASVRGARGQLAEAERILGEVERSASADKNPRGAGNAWFAHAWLARLAGHSTPPEPEGMKGTSWARAAAALRAAEAGDSTVARNAVDGWPDPMEPDEASHRALRDHVEACLALRRGHWTAAVERLRGNAAGGARDLPNLERVLRTRSRWLIADAFGKLGRPDSVAAYLQLILEPPAYETPHVFWRGLWEPFVRCRLVDVYASMGRLADARREWDAVSSTCTRPDPELVAMLDATRARLQDSQGMRGERDR